MSFIYSYTVRERACVSVKNSKVIIFRVAGLNLPDLGTLHLKHFSLLLKFCTPHC